MKLKMAPPTRVRVLSTPLVGYHRGEQLPQPYRAVLVRYEDGRAGLQVEEFYPKSGNWGPVPSGWYLETLLGVGEYSRIPMGDEVAIDYGQAWSVRGMKAALREALRLEGEEQDSMRARASLLAEREVLRRMIKDVQVTLRHGYRAETVLEIIEDGLRASQKAALEQLKGEEL